MLDYTRNSPLSRVSSSRIDSGSVGFIYDSLDGVTPILLITDYRSLFIQKRGLTRSASCPNALLMASALSTSHCQL